MTALLVLSTSPGPSDLGLQPQPEAAEDHEDDGKGHDGHDPIVEPVGDEGAIVNGLQQVRWYDDLGPLMITAVMASIWILGVVMTRSHLV